jgi:cytochrome c oxidase subunit 2
MTSPTPDETAATQPERARATAPVTNPDRPHLIRVISIWGLLSVILTPIVYFVWGPHMPPGNSSNVARSQQFDNQVLATVATPVVLFIWTYLGYAITCFRGRGTAEDGPPIKGHGGFQTGWLLVTTAIVMSLFVFGTYQLITPAGAGTGSGANPIWVPPGYSATAKSNKIFQVQVIAQQWRWTFRYPAFGGVETTQLEIPVGTEIQFNVTSLDVIHEFWAQQLAVKADANPGVNDIAFARANRPGNIDIKCAELCGTLHGAMTAQGSVVSQVDFTSWITNEMQVHAADIPLLPPYAVTYLPAPDGGYYDPGQDPVPDTSVPTPSPSSSGPPTGTVAPPSVAPSSSASS